MISPEPLNHSYPKLGMVLYYHEMVCHAEKLVHCLQSQGHSEDLYNKSMAIYTISSKLLVYLLLNLVWQYNSVSWSVLCKNWVTVFKFKVTAKVQNVSDCPGDITADHFDTKLSMVLQHHEPVCHAEKLVGCLQCQDHS